MKKNVIRLLVCVLIGAVIWWLYSDDYDSGKPTEFYKIEESKTDRVSYEIYVVHNAPYDTLEIKKVIEKFNLETWAIDSLKKYGGGGRLFYRETKYMTRHFKEGDPYDPEYSSWDNTQDYRNHFKDILMTTSYSINPAGDGDCYYRYWLYWNYWNNIDAKYDNKVHILFRDLDSLYRAKKKEYGIEE